MKNKSLRFALVLAALGGAVFAAPAPKDITITVVYHDTGIEFGQVIKAGALAAEAVRVVKANERLNLYSRLDVPWKTFLKE